MSSGLLGIGTSGLLASQRGLSVTGHNISNSATEGYSRQRLDLNTRTPQFAGNGYFGTGVEVGGVNRVFDQFVENQLRTATSSSAQYSAFHDYAKRVDSLLANPDSGLAPGLQSFFAAAQDVATDPTSLPARQVLISEADSLSDRFGFLHQRLDDQRALVNGQIQTTVDEINGLSKALAEVNRGIVGAMGRAGGAPPNDLLDQRDKLVRELAERVNVSTVAQDDGSLNVFVGNGQSLVVGSTASMLTAAPLGEDPTQIGIGYASTGGNVADISRFMTGGRLGALLDVRSSVLDVAQNALGRTALGLAEAFNEQHALGQDLLGNVGGDFFRLPEAEVLARSDNSAAGQPVVTIADPGQLTTEDYRLRFDGSDWELRRVPSGQPVDPEAVGLAIDTDAITGAAAGDSFLVRPTRTAAQQIGTVISDARQVAAGSPVRVSADSENTGVAVARSVQAENAEALDTSPATVTFNAGSSQFEVGGEVVPLDPSGVTEVRHNGWTLAIQGTPADGDRFTVSANTGGVGDNTNALALAGLQDARFLAGGTATLEGGYNTMIGEVGTRTRQAEVASASQARLLEEARNQRDSISGVNLDEEAANLLRYQQAYQAAAQVIAVSSTLFDTLLGAVRR
ncbi:flagellar hook-associated protein FlgK [Thioalkalivibrio sp.]|uniref:flagellar hook-associated protein FlgK n=1 Tax=Thioalkalivibrio sp. TaxID=2093813 RepID=UPI0012D54E2E|nr:flagellar hook-associated protein FlgK [Thioalkalivibrio sp.]TVP83033.1 MAG: flagellar hook-associated protein FlgK [Thioalkalivibrio sp.]